MNLRKSILKILMFACLTVPISIFAQGDTLELPFFEDWGSNSLTVHKRVVGTNYVENKSQFYTSCLPPENFAVEVDTGGNNQYQLNFSWQMDEPEPGWIHWDNGVHFQGIGCCQDISAAARWDSAQLVDYHNFRIAKMRIILNDTALDSLVFKIWDGEFESDLIYHDTIYEFYEGSWIEHELESAIYIDAMSELFVGYTALDMPAGTFTLGTDNGPAVAGYGDLIRPDNNISWDLLSDWNIDYNWNIQFYAEDTSGNQIKIARGIEDRNVNFIGYNLYQRINGGDFELLEFIPWVLGDTTHSIPFEASPEVHCYQLTAIWTIGSDTCESTPALSKDNPDEDFVCVLLVGNEENRIDQSVLVRCFPNPFSNSTTIEYTLSKAETVQISIFNHLGNQVDFIQEKQSPGKQQVVWEAKGLPPGVYYFRMQASEQVASGKMILVR